MPKVVKIQTLIIILAVILFVFIGFSYFFLQPFQRSMPGNINSLASTDTAAKESKSFLAADKQMRSEEAPLPASINTIGQNVPKMEQKIIKTASLRYKVKDYHKSRSAIFVLIKKHQAYLASEDEENQDDTIQNSMSIRVPATQFDGLMDSLVKESIHLENKNVQAQDVTAEFIDTQARLKAKKAVEQRYLAILTQARSIKDILEIEAQLGTIRESIESTEGQLKYLSDQVMYSTISLTFYQSVKRLPRPESGFWYNIGTAFIKGWDGMLSVIIGAIYIWPFLIIAVLLLLAYRKFRRKAKGD